MSTSSGKTIFITGLYFLIKTFIFLKDSLLLIEIPTLTFANLSIISDSAAMSVPLELRLRLKLFFPAYSSMGMISLCSVGSPPIISRVFIFRPASMSAMLLKLLSVISSQKGIV